VREEHRGAADPAKAEFKDAFDVIAQNYPLDEGGKFSDLGVTTNGGEVLQGAAFTGTIRVVLFEGELPEVIREATTYRVDSSIMVDAATKRAYLRVPKTTQLFVAVRDGWYVKYRITYGAPWRSTGRSRRCESW
jgi:hypothetical protein